MTDSDIRTLKTYLRDCLEPRLRKAVENVEFYAQQEKEAENHLDSDIAAKMRGYFRSQAEAYQHAIDDFKELFEEELKEGE